VKIIIWRFYSLILSSIFPFLNSIEFSKTIDFHLISLAFFFQFLQFKRKYINFFSKCVNMIRFLLNISLSIKNFSFSTRYLFTQCSNLTLDIIIWSAFFIEIESWIVTLFFQTLKSDKIWVMSGLKIVVLT